MTTKPKSMKTSRSIANKKVTVCLHSELCACCNAVRKALAAELTNATVVTMNGCDVKEFGCLSNANIDKLIHIAHRSSFEAINTERHGRKP